MSAKRSRSDDEDDKLKPPRPQANPVLLGQEAAEARLLHAWKSGRMPHGWLITGPRGVGKATLAYRLARKVLAEVEAKARAAEEPGLFGEAPAAAPPEGSLYLPPDHPVFHLVASGGHPDLMTVTRTVNPKDRRPPDGLEKRKKKPKEEKVRDEITIDDVRPVQSFLHMTASGGGWRVVVVDAAEEMNRNAANAILKALEEPPNKALLLLVSHAPGRLLPTIRSRCCSLPMAGIADDQVAGLLAEHRPDISEADRRLLTGLAEGSPGKAFGLAEAGGIALYRELIGLLQGLPRLDTAGLHGLADRWSRAQDSEAFRSGMELLAWWLGRLIRAGATGRAPQAVLPEEEALLARLAGGLADPGALEQWLALWEKVNRLAALAGALNLDRKQVILTAFFELERAAA